MSTTPDAGMILEAFVTGVTATVSRSVIAGEPWSDSVVFVIATDGDTLTYTTDGMWSSTVTRSDRAAWAYGSANVGTTEDFVAAHGDRTFVVEFDSGVFVADAAEMAHETAYLAPGESMRLHAAPLTVELARELESSRPWEQVLDDDVMAAMWNADPSVPDADKFHA